MALKDVTNADLFERTLIYGDPKTSKTRLATSLPPRFGEIIYYAADPGSEALDSVLLPYRERIHVVKSSPVPGTKYDPDADAFQFALNDWQKQFPLVKTMVWDTLTATADDLLGFIADEGKFSDKAHIAIGSSANKQNIAMQGDYMAVHNRIDRLLDFLFKVPMHLLVLCHATYDEPREGADPAKGGPATAGKAKVRKLPGRFPSVFHTTRRYIPSKIPGDAAESVYTVYTETHGMWTAGLRSCHLSNPIPKVNLDPDPINFWNLRDKALHLNREEEK